MKNLFYCTLAIVALVGCKPEKSGQSRIFVDIDNSVVFSAKDMEEMHRVDDGAFQLKVADMVRYVPELGILVKSGNDLFLFDDKTNSVTAKFGRLGRAKDEYTFISDFGYDKDAGQVYLYDMNSKRINWNSLILAVLPQRLPDSLSAPSENTVTITLESVFSVCRAFRN